MTNSELYHHGIQGMHWGVRRTPQQLGHTTKQIERSESFKKKNKAKKAEKVKSENSSNTGEVKKEVRKSVHEMSTQEIKDAIDRQKQINEYNKVVLGQKDHSEAKAFVKSAFKKIVLDAAVDVAAEQSKKFIRKKLEEAASKKK